MRLIGLAACALTQVLAQEPPRFSIDVQFVMVDVQVTERGTGAVLELLSSNDFELYDNGRRRDIKWFQFESAPLDIVFLSYGKSGWGTAKDINNFLGGLNAAPAELRVGDRAAVLRTDSESKVDLQMSEDREKIRYALVRGDRYRTGHDRLYDALKAATTLFPRPKDRVRRRAIVAITDDIERGSKTTLDQLITELLEADATLNAAVVVLGKQGRGEVGVGGVWGIPRVGRDLGGSRSGASIRPAIEATGGEAIPGDLFQERFPELVRRLRLRYSIGFYAEPAKQREYRTLEVRLSPEARKKYPNALVRARRGYYAAPYGAGYD